MALGELKNGIGPDAYAIYQQVLAAVVERDHPVGSLYISNDPTSPASLFGGTWERIKDRFILAAGDTYAAGSTGGEATHTLTFDEMPRHVHIQRKVVSDTNAVTEVNKNKDGPYSGDELGVNQISWYSGKQAVTTDFAGSDQPHNNMLPYITMYVWKRIA